MLAVYCTVRTESKPKKKLNVDDVATSCRLLQVRAVDGCASGVRQEPVIDVSALPQSKDE